MRKIVAGLFISLDGVVEAPEKWTGKYFCPEVGQTVGRLIAGGDTLLMGRVTYNTFKTSFANNRTGDPMAANMNSVRKVVLSNTLSSADWQNTTLVSSNFETAIQALKNEDGKNINISGSGTLVSWLLQKHLLDELHLLVFPIVLGHGQRLFQDSADEIPLRLAASESCSTGVLRLEYHLTN